LFELVTDEAIVESGLCALFAALVAGDDIEQGAH